MAENLRRGVAQVVSPTPPVIEGVFYALVVHTEHDETMRIISARAATRHYGMKAKRTNDAAQMRREYDFDYSKATRGKYYKRLLKQGCNVVVLERDIAEAFPDSASVNKALRSVLKDRRPRRPAKPRRDTA